MSNLYHPFILPRFAFKKAPPKRGKIINGEEVELIENISTAELELLCDELKIALFKKVGKTIPSETALLDK